MQSLDATFSALGDSTRRAILARLASGETTLSELAAPFEMSQTAVSKHVRILSDAGLVEVEKRGRSRHCRLVAEPMRQAADWIADYRQFWMMRFDALSEFLRDEETGR